MKLNPGAYIVMLLTISFSFFYVICAIWMKTDQPYTDLLLTIAVAHLVLSKLVTIQKIEEQE